MSRKIRTCGKIHHPRPAALGYADFSTGRQARPSAWLGGLQAIAQWIFLSVGFQPLQKSAAGIMRHDIALKMFEGDKRLPRGE